MPACPAVSCDSGLCPGCEDEFDEHLENCPFIGRLCRLKLGQTETHEVEVDLTEVSLHPTARGKARYFGDEGVRQEFDKLDRMADARRRALELAEYLGTNTCRGSYPVYWISKTMTLAYLPRTDGYIQIDQDDPSFQGERYSYEAYSREEALEKFKDCYNEYTHVGKYTPSPAGFRINSGRGTRKGNSTQGRVNHLRPKGGPCPEENCQKELDKRWCHGHAMRR